MKCSGSSLFVTIATSTLFAGLACAQNGMTGRATVEPLATVRVASGLSRPVFATHAPGDFTRLFIVEQHTARIMILNIKTGAINAQPFIDLDPVVIGSGSERGLLGLAFHPNYESNGNFYVNYNNNGGDTVIARYTVTTDPDVANPSSSLVLMTIDQPQSNHNGGWMGFGPSDGFLYIATGDGGGSGDTGSGHTPGLGNSQDITNNLLGKMLRIDVDGDDGPGGAYGIPDSNPFVAKAGDDEIWSFGLRNPWRNCFDRLTGDLYIGDVGQGAWEEIDFQSESSAGGENYGWRCREGAHDYDLSGDCTQTPFVDPIHEYSHGGSPFRCSITGGYIYRGCSIPTLDGSYFFADYCSNQIWTFTYDGGSVGDLTDRTDELDPPGYAISSISSFGEDARGEVYICDLGGEVFKIVPVTPTISYADVDCNGVVDVLDLLAVLGVWGPCDGCVEDLNGDGEVDVLDLLAVLAEWG